MFNDFTAHEGTDFDDFLAPRFHHENLGRASVAVCCHSIE